MKLFNKMINSIPLLLSNIEKSFRHILSGHFNGQDIMFVLFGIAIAIIVLLIVYMIGLSIYRQLKREQDISH